MQSEDEFQAAPILLVEKSADYLSILKFLIERLEHKFVCIDKGQYAVDLCAAQKFQIVLINLDLPLYGSFWATEKIREFNQTIPIIGYTLNKISKELRRLAAMSGMQDIRNYWFSKYDLAQTLNKWCATRNYHLW